MANIFLDANMYVDLVEHRKYIFVDDIFAHYVFISPLSIHIHSYIYKYVMPDETLSAIKEYLTIVALDETITHNALRGPTKYLEDNMQLQSAASADCSYFLTHDKNLLKLGVFGTMRIVPNLSLRG